MKTQSLSAWLARIDAAEYGVCRRLNRGASRRSMCATFRVASRLGDGSVWYALIGILPLLYGTEGLNAAIGLTVSGAVGVVLYKWLKQTFVRERPFITHAGISLAAAPLDRYSFPSGHTLHAISFTWQTVALFPELGWVLIPLAALIAASRVVLGLHYPSDVLAGGAIGAGLAALALAMT